MFDKWTQCIVDRVSLHRYLMWLEMKSDESLAKVTRRVDSAAEIYNQ